MPRYGRYRVLIKRDGVDAGDVASVQTSIMGTIKTYAENDHSATIRLYDKNGELVELDSAGNTEYQVGEDGIFEIKLPEAGEYKMLISKAGYLSEEQHGVGAQQEGDVVKKKLTTRFKPLSIQGLF